MRGPSKSLPSYRRHRKSGQAIVTLNGQDFYLGKHGTKASKTNYERIIGEWLANGRRIATVVESNPLSVMKLCSQYWVFAKGYYVKNGEKTDELASIKAAMRFLKQSYGKTAAKDFGPLALEVVRNQMIDAGNSRGYINGNVNRIRRMFRWAVSRELVPVGSYQALATLPGLKKGKSSAKETEPVQPVDAETVEATLKHAKPIIADMIRLQLLLGCRPGEVCSIKPCEIDRSHDVWRYQPLTHKMEHKGRNRTILIGPQAQAILFPYLLRDENKTCFEKPKGGPFKRWNYNEKIKQACNRAFPAPKEMKGAELKAWRKRHAWAPNRLRHSRATDIREKYGLESAQAVLGHATADVTQIYAERDIAKAARIMAEVG